MTKKIIMTVFLIAQPAVAMEVASPASNINSQQNEIPETLVGIPKVKDESEQKSESQVPQVRFQGLSTSTAHLDEIIDLGDNSSAQSAKVSSKPRYSMTLDPAHVNVNEDIPGCTDDYFRCMRNFWLISGGWFDFSAMITGGVGASIAGISSQGNFDESQQSRLSLVACILGGISFVMQATKAYAVKSSVENEEKLRKVIAESHQM